MPHAQASESVDPLASAGVGRQLFVNDGPLHTSEVGHLRRSSPDLPIEELRRRYAEDGYVYLKGLIPRRVVTTARERYFQYLAPTGILKPGTTPGQGIFDPAKDRNLYPGIGAGAAGANGHPGQHAAQFVDMAIQTHYQPWYADEFCRNRELFEFIQKFTGWEQDTFFCKRSLLRNNVPETQAIGVHYDQIFLRHGEPTSVTAWVPIGDVSVEGGGLIYLEKGMLRPLPLLLRHHHYQS
jgi:phytanoyl-CoA hydroxylase